MSRSWGVLLAVWACRPEEPERTTDTPSEVGPTGDTAAPHDTDTGTPPAAHTGTPLPPPLCEAEQETTSGALVEGWRSPGGTLYAVARSPSARVRAPDGTWTLDVAHPAMADALAVHGIDDDHVWAATPTAVLRREPGGTWVDAGLPPGDGLVRGVHVRGPEEVLVLRVDQGDRAVHTSFWRWDGAAWATAAGPDLNVHFGAWGVTSGGAVVIGDHDGLILAGGARVPFDVTLEVEALVVAPDDTIVVAGSDHEWHPKIAVGTLAGMTVVDASPGNPHHWSDLWAESADDVWLAYDQQLLRSTGLYEYPATVAHWDGTTFTTVVPEHPASTLRLADGGADRVFALGGHDVEVALVGDLGGLQVDREGVAPGRLHRPFVDDVTGEVWSTTFSGDPDELPEDGRRYGPGPVLARFADGVWTAVPLDEPVQALELAASSGRLVLRTPSSDTPSIGRYEGGRLTLDALPEDTFAESVAAAGGALFAGARRGVGPTAVPAVLRHAGSGWEPLDTVGLPTNGAVQALWADDDDDLWAAVGGELQRWDGSAWTLAATFGGASTVASHLRRSGDGALYLQVHDALAGDVTWRFDGAAGSVVPDLPEGTVDDLEVTPEGEAFVAVHTPPENPFSFEVVVTRILRRDVTGGSWVELATQDRIDAPWPIVARGSEVWVALDGTRSWSRSRCP